MELAPWALCLTQLCCSSPMAGTVSDAAVITNDAEPASDPTTSPGRIERLQALLTTPNSGRVLVVAHRACWEHAPENSLKAIGDCIRLGVEMVELDVRRTADGVLVLMHDATVDRTTDGSGAVGDLTYAELSVLRLREGEGGPTAALTDHVVPTFADALLAAKGELLINLDAKADVFDDAFLVLKETGTTGQILMKRRVDIESSPLGASQPFDQVYNMPILDQAVGEPGPVLDAQLVGNPVAVELVFTSLSYAEEPSRIAGGQQIRRWANTLNPRTSAGLIDEVALLDPDGVWGTLIELGFDVIQTDEPAALQAYLQQHRSNATAH